MSTDALSFPNVYAGVVGLAKRIENVQAIGPNGEPNAVAEVAPGEFRTRQKFERFSFEANLSEPLQPNEMSHVSWLNSQGGLLMMADLLPQVARQPSAVIQVNVPPGFTVASNTKGNGQNQFSTSEIAKAVFFVGASLQSKLKRVGLTEFSIVTSAQWPGSDSDPSNIAARILKSYTEITGFSLPDRTVLMLLPFREEDGSRRWTAETRGNCIVILVARQSTREALAELLGLVLTHELFHRWVPNSLQLTGDYDWFFEGFTLYEALQVALGLHLIRFSDYLETIGRVYDSYLSTPDRDRLSLIEISARRWTNSSQIVYDKGMLIAFLYDLMLRRVSKHERSLQDLYRRLFRLPPLGREDANEVIIAMLNDLEGGSRLSESYIRGVSTIDLASLVAPFGIKVEQIGSRTRLTVFDHVNQEQQKLLRTLGYKN